jgi:hypothetical protein
MGKIQLYSSLLKFEKVDKVELENDRMFCYTS